MKGFIISLLCVGTVLTAPQYNYNPPSSGVGLGPVATGPSGGGDDELGGGLLDVRLGNIPVGPSIGGGVNQVQHSSHSQHSQHSQHSSGHIGVGGQNFASHGISSNRYSHGSSVGVGNRGPIGGGIGGGFGGSFGGNFGSSSGAGISGGHGAHQTIVTKQFFIHAAPQEQDEIGGDKVINLGPGRKHYRVVFIKAPHQNIQGGKVRFVAPANEEKTVIYVLSKKTELSDIAADVQQAHSEPTKPDVFFIKYKTPEEAIHAQRQIQAQYDQLGGTSQITDEGVAPISSVIGALGHTGSAGSHVGGGSSQHGFTSSGSTSYETSGAAISNIASTSHHINTGNVGSATYLPPNH